MTAPRDRQGGLALVLWPYTTMDDEGLPLSSLLPLSQPAVQAPHDIPDAPPSSESTGGDVGTQASHSCLPHAQGPRPLATGGYPGMRANGTIVPIRAANESRPPAARYAPRR